jgi:hypothetical protein
MEVLRRVGAAKSILAAVKTDAKGLGYPLSWGRHGLVAVFIFLATNRIFSLTTTRSHAT